MRDILGTSIQRGSVVAYSVRQGCSCALNVGVVEDEVRDKLKVRAVYEGWSSGQLSERVVYVSHPDRLVVLNPTQTTLLPNPLANRLKIVAQELS